LGLARVGDQFQDADFQRLERWQGWHCANGLCQLNKAEVNIGGAGSFAHVNLLLGGAAFVIEI
jgi:hypothetical protein